MEIHSIMNPQKSNVLHHTLRVNCTPCLGHLGYQHFCLFRLLSCARLLPWGDVGAPALCLLTSLSATYAPTREYPIGCVGKKLRVSAHWTLHSWCTKVRLLMVSDKVQNKAVLLSNNFNLKPWYLRKFPTLSDATR